METIDFNEVIRDNIEVVGGLLGNPFSYKGGVSNDFNNYVNTGIYRFTGPLIANNPGFQFGQLRVYNDTYYIIQEAISVLSPFNIKKRRRENGSWTDWV